MLIGEKVILEEIDPANIEQMRLWRNDVNLKQYFREYKDITKPMQEKWYNERGNNSNPEHIYFQIMEYKNEANQVRKNPDGRVLIGCCGLHYIQPRIKSAEFGIFIGKMSSRGGGKGKEALKILLCFGFLELNLNKIFCEVYKGNMALVLYENIGFQHDGINRHAQFSNGEYIDSDMLSMLQSEWLGKYGKKPMWEIK